jgi:O-methyltransferase
MYKTDEELLNLSEEILSKGISMTIPERFGTIIRHRDKIAAIDGDVIECGCWKGGFSIFMSYAFPEKKMWMCDSYEAGFQSTDVARHKYYDLERHRPDVNWQLLGFTTNEDYSFEGIKQRFLDYSLDDVKRFNFVKGYVKDTLPNLEIDKISLLRVDVDAYSATLEVLEELYDKVQVGGYIIFDDTGLYETTDAMNDFFTNRGIERYVYHVATDEKIWLPERSNPNYKELCAAIPGGCYRIKE